MGIDMEGIKVCI